MKLLDGFKWFLNPVWVMDAFLTLWGGGGPGPQTSTGTTYTSNLPEYAKPFFEQALVSAGKNVFETDTSGAVTGVKPMPTYTGERIAGFTPGQVGIQRDIAGLTTPGGFGTAENRFRYGFRFRLWHCRCRANKSIGLYTFFYIWWYLYSWYGRLLW
jgi:hypothetical protein